MTGIANDAPTNEHILRSDDGRAAVWAGAIDDVWKLGKPRGFGGPWKNSTVTANQPSDPYLMTGFDRKSLTLWHTATKDVTLCVELDLNGSGLWRTYESFVVPPGKDVAHDFPAALTGYWMRVVADSDCQATAQLRYE